MAVSTNAVLAASSCIGGGCPGSGSGANVADIVIGVALVVVGLAGLIGSQLRNRRERIGMTEQRAASVMVTLGRAIGIVLVIIGLIMVIFQP